MESSKINLDEIIGGIKVDGVNPYAEANCDSWGSIPLWISTGSISLDYAIAGFRKGFKGGIPIGRVTEVNGMESVGKSVLIDHIARETLKVGAFFLCDPEHSHDEERIKLIGADLTNFRFIQRPREADNGGKGKRRLSSGEGIMVLEEFFDTAEATLVKFRQEVNDEIPIVIALDSLAAIDTKRQSEADKELNQRDRLDKSIVMSERFGNLCSLITKNNGALIIVNQLRSKPGIVYGDSTYSPGGDAKNFYFSLRIRMDSTKKITAAEDFGKDTTREYLDKDVTGIEGHGRVVKNKVAEPYRTFRFPLFFDERGIWEELNFAYLLEDRKKWEFDNEFEKSGATYAWKGDKIGVGTKGLALAFQEDPKLLIEMEEALFLNDGEEG